MKHRSFAQRLLKWYFSRVRPMPWRGDSNPYHIWLSEVMLQQTQVETVIPYYLRWLEKYPTVEDVAGAPLDDILKSWEGLGYYARARNFHQACQQVVAQHAGRVPSDPEAFSKLKGIGPYSVGAVLSIAFEKKIPAIDGNVKRVVARVLKINTAPSKSLDKIKYFLDAVICPKRPGDFNQAMMDLGAKICTTRNPRCESCPVSAMCEAYKSEKVHLYPKPEKKLTRPHYHIAVGIIWKGNQILISKRKPQGMLGGLWEFPGGKVMPRESAQRCVAREVKEELGVSVEVGPRVGKIKHDYTHFSIEMEGFHCRYVSGKPKAIECADFRWIKLSEIRNYAFPKANHKLFPLLHPDVSLSSPRRRGSILTAQ